MYFFVPCLLRDSENEEFGTFSQELLRRIARAVKREFRVLFFRRNQKSACKPASMIVGDTHSLLYVQAHMNN